MTLADRRAAVQMLIDGGLSTLRACQLASISRATFRYRAQTADDTAIVAQMQELARRYPRYGYRRITALLRQEQPINQKRVRRLWRQHQFQVRRVRRPRIRRSRPDRLQAAYPGHIWAYDFVEDALMDGTPLRILTVMDEFTREGLAIDVARTTSAERVIGALAPLSFSMAHQCICEVTMARNSWQRQCNSGLWSGVSKRCTSSQGSPGKMGRRSASTEPCATNA